MDPKHFKELHAKCWERENNAHAGYLEIRRQLFEGARIGYDASN